MHFDCFGGLSIEEKLHVRCVCALFLASQFPLFFLSPLSLSVVLGGLSRCCRLALALSQSFFMARRCRCSAVSFSGISRWWSCVLASLIMCMRLRCVQFSRSFFAVVRCAVDWCCNVAFALIVVLSQSSSTCCCVA